MINLESMCDMVILFGSAYFMIGRIIDSFAKPTSKIKQKRKEKEKQQLIEILGEVLPDYLRQHDLETRDRYKADRERYLKEIRDSVLEENKGVLDEIKEMNLEQNETMSKMNRMLDYLNNSSKDVLRQKIMAIYHANRHTKTLTIYDKEALDELYKDYKAQMGNSYIDKYYNRMKLWKVVDDNDLDE